MECLTPRFVFRTLCGVIVLTWILISPSTAMGTADSNVAFGFGMHATVHMSSGIDDNSAAGVGGQDVRLRDILTPQTYQVVLELTYYL